MEDKLLGEGGFGCVFQPEISCVRDTIYLKKKKRGVHHVSKVFTYMDTVQKENAYSKLIYTWDKDGKYFVVPTKLCKTTLTEIHKNRASSQCESLHSIQPRYIPQIVMPFAGKDMFKFLEEYVVQHSRKFPLQIWIKLLENVFIAAQILHQQGYVHLDIKADNLLYDGTRLRVSDFGLMTQQKRVYQSQLDNLSLTYFPYPLEILLVGYKYFHSCKEVGCSIYYEYMNSLHSFGKQTADQFMEYHPITEIDNEIQRLEHWTQEDPAWFEQVREQTEKIDVYSIGSICIDLERFFDFSHVSRNTLARYRMFVKTLTTLDFRIRPTIHEAYQLYKQIM